MAETPRRLQRRRSAGWRMPEGAVYVGRPSPWGNPFLTSGDRQPWMAVAFGEHGDMAGRRAAVVKGFRWWITKGGPETFPIAASRPDDPGGAVEFSGGTVRSIADMVVGLSVRTFLREPLVLPSVPDLEPLRGRDLVCWCPLDQPCHADVLLELANR